MNAIDLAALSFDADAEVPAEDFACRLAAALSDLELLLPEDAAGLAP